MTLCSEPILKKTDPRWPVFRVDEVGRVQLGRQRTPKYQTGKHTHPYLRVANVYDNRFDLTDVLSMDFDARDFETYRLEDGDILLNEGQSSELVGRPALWRGEISNCCFQNTLVRFQADRAKLTPEFALAVFRYYFHTGQFSQISSKTSNVAHLGSARFAAMPFPLPPMSEQRRIADVLGRAEALRAKRRAALAQIDELTISLFLDMFGDPARNPRGWAIATLKSLTVPGDRINYGVVQPGDDFAGGVPLIRVGDIRNGEINHRFLKRIAPCIESAYRRSRLIGTEILVSCVGSIGEIAVADQSVVGYNIARAVARIPIAEADMRTYLSWFLRTDFVRKYFTSELRTVSQPTLNIEQIGLLQVLVPSLPLQQEFARRVQAIDRLKAKHRQSLAEMDALFASLQHRAFRGEL